MNEISWKMRFHVFLAVCLIQIFLSSAPAPAQMSPSNSTTAVRTRPILMTAFATAVGMLPIALERAIGLERLSPLAIITIGGLMVSTFLTLLYVPIFYTFFKDITDWFSHLFSKSD